jgi:hypothetical protein
VIIAVSCAGYFRSSARRAWRNCKTFSGLEASDEYNAGERRVGMITRWIELGDDDSCVERWVKNLMKGADAASASVKSRLGRSDVGTKCIFAEEGRIRRLLRSKS